MRALPVGVPKLMVSTMAAGDTRDYVGGSDLTLMASVTDVAGINSISGRILANAAAAMAGMVQADAPAAADERPLIGATMFGVTTPCVSRAREVLEERGYEVLVFHATGTGGRAMEALVDARLPRAGCSTRRRPSCATTSSAASSRRARNGSRRPGASGLPQVVSVGALDMVNFGARDSVPPQFEARNLYVHNPSVTLMRTTAEESAELGRRIARKLSAATGPVALFVPLRGVSMIDVEGQPFHDPEADAALFAALREGLDRERVELVELDLDVNDPAFAEAMADTARRPRAEARDDRRRGPGEAARDARRRRRDHRRGRGHRPVGQVRRGGRRRPDHHLQLRPLPDGGPRLAGRPDALRRRQRDRASRWATRCCPWRATRRCWRASAAPIRSG